MDAKKYVFMFQKQNIVRKIYTEAKWLKLGVTHPLVIKAIIEYFSLGPQTHRNFKRLVRELSQTCWVS